MLLQLIDASLGHACKMLVFVLSAGFFGRRCGKAAGMLAPSEDLTYRMAVNPAK